MQLVITEKPSVAKSIAEVLHATEHKNGYLQGNGYLVSWCVGHLVELASADTYREEWKKWAYETLPIIPDVWQYQVKENTRKQYEILKGLFHNPEVTEVICATDAGREGELIFRLVYEQAGCRKPFKRLWISSMEEKAIEDGFRNLRESREYDDLYQSAVCRSVADWLVGINATRLFTVLYRHKLTVGRVQTPTLAMLVDREQSITDFKKEQYFLAHLLCGGMDAVTERINDKNKAEQIAGACRNGQALIISVNREEKTVNPPKLYDLTTLQREANRLFGFTAQQTLDYAQSLYEKKLVTYPRTDSQFLTEDMGQTAGDIAGVIKENISSMQGITHEPKVEKVLNSKKVSDHHAIIPTMELAKADLDKIPGGEMQILSLIAQRLICATGEKHIYETVKAELSCNGIMFTATGKSILQNGWKTYEEQFKKSLKSGNSKAEKEETPLPQLSEGMTFEQVETKVSEHFTAPPKHFTEDNPIYQIHRNIIVKAVETQNEGASGSEAGTEGSNDTETEESGEEDGESESQEPDTELPVIPEIPEIELPETEPPVETEIPCGDEEKRRRITEKIENLLNNKKDFYGFDKSNSDAPPNAYAKEGRANPKGISYLYTAKDIKTAILEMRPQMQKMYNIAIIEIIRDAKIFDFTYSPEKIKEDEYSIVADLHRISEEFSKPNFGDQIEYAPTQFLCEYIKRLGFDGIKFKSAVSATGTNVLLFDVDAKTRVYDITGSKVYTVNTLDIDISQVMPMENEDKEQSQMLFICYPKCSTCQKAKKWLDEHNIKYTERHIVEVNPTYDELKEWYGKSGLPLKKFFNTSGLLYKEMQLKDKLPTMSEEEQLQLLATNGMLVKRPLVVNGGTVLVGFKEAEWSEKLN